MLMAIFCKPSLVRVILSHVAPQNKNSVRKGIAP
ncbi:hypothetical protein THICB2_200006 [Thiomonas sp. CB2]|nr:hypothetical protein THICB2_200006 [Thiomonas sp. CB2]